MRGLRRPEHGDQWIGDHLDRRDAGGQHEQRAQKQREQSGTRGGYEQQAASIISSSPKVAVRM